jgi:hypothetical protein
VAKKARKKLEEDAEVGSFQFPEFDERSFIAHEFEQTIATGFAVAIAVGLAALSFGIDRGLSAYSQPTLQWLVPLAVSIAVIAFSPLIVQRLRPNAPEYTRGDWASVILLEVFGWLGFWFLFTDVLGAH